MKKYLVFFILLFIPLVVHASYKADFETIDNQVIWMEWTYYESGDLGQFNSGYDCVHAKNVAFGRYQFYITYQIPTFINEVLNARETGFDELEPYKDKSYLSSHKSEFCILWHKLEKNNPEIFNGLQDESAYQDIYLPTKKALLKKGIDINKFGPVIRGTVWSIAIRVGVLDTSVPSSETYQALIDTYHEGITEEEYLLNMMDSLASYMSKKDPGDVPRWKTAQKEQAVSAMGVQNNVAVTKNYTTNKIGGALGGLYEDPFKEINLLETAEVDCTNIFMANETELNDLGKSVNELFKIIKIGSVALLIILTTLDISKTIMSNELDTKKMRAKLVKRIVITLIIFFLPDLLDLLFHLFGLYNISTCGIGEA